jgi:signal transduction histidine kinase
MTGLPRQQTLRMEGVKAWLRLGIIAVALTQGFLAASWPVDSWRVVALTAAALAYATFVVAARPYRVLPLRLWDAVSGFVDWGFITAGIVVTGGASSDLYMLYFLSVLSVAMRYGFREVMAAALGTALGYLGVALAVGPSGPPAFSAVVARMGYLVLFGAGSGLLARESHRHFRARVAQEAHRQSLREVTATVGHDLMNPLAAITGLVEMLLDSTADTLSFEQRALLHRVNANTQQMAELVSNLLDAELLEGGRQAFRPTSVDLNGLVQRVVEAQAHQAEVKHIGLVLDLSARLPKATVDARMIERLVANLLSNAVKFTPEGGAVRVSTSCRGSRLIIEVWDSGPDVPAALQATLFEKFVHEPGSPGAGLGLYICKSVVEMHRGEIRVQQPDEGGVSFVAALPLTAPMIAAAPAMSSAAADSRRWLPASAARPAGG